MYTAFLTQFNSGKRISDKKNVLIAFFSFYNLFSDFFIYFFSIFIINIQSIQLSTISTCEIEGTNLKTKY